MRKDSAPPARLGTKCALAVVGMLAVTSSAFAQKAPEDKEAPKTKLETFLATKGSMVVKDFYELGSVRGMSIDALVIYEPGKEGTKIKGLRAEITDGGRLSNSHSSFLDMDELESLAGALDYMGKLMGEWKGHKREAYTEVTFQTKGDFKLGFFQKGDDQRLFASSGIIGKADFFGTAEDLPKIRTLLGQAIDKLKGLQ
jgi:hypothetical protein